MELAFVCVCVCLKDYRFSVACNTERMNCFRVLMGIISNALLGIFNFTELIKTEQSTLPFVSMVLTYVRDNLARGKGQELYSLPPEFESHFYYLLASLLAIPGFTVCICKMGNRIVPILHGGCED